MAANIILATAQTCGATRRSHDANFKLIAGVNNLAKTKS